MVILIIAGLGVGLSLAVPLIIIQSVSNLARFYSYSSLIALDAGDAFERNGFIDIFVAVDKIARRHNGYRRLPSGH